MPDALERVKTANGDAAPVNDEIPCFLFEDDEEYVDWVSWGKDLFGKPYSYDSAVLALALDPRVVSEPRLVDEWLREQSTDAFCSEVRERIADGKRSRFQARADGVLIRRCPLDDSHRIVVLGAPNRRVLHLNHILTSARHPGSHRM